MVLTYFAMEGFLGWKGRISIYYSGAFTRKVNWEFLGSFFEGRRVKLVGVGELLLGVYIYML